MTRVVINKVSVRMLVGALGMLLGSLGGTCISSAMPDEIPGIVISGIQTGDLLSASNEFIQISNSSSSQVDITDYCLNYASVSNETAGSHLLCFTTTEPLHRLILPPFGTATVESNTFHLNYPTIPADSYFSSGFSGSGGHLLLLDATGMLVDKVGWGNASFPEGQAATAVGSLGSLHRKTLLSGYLQDTDNNSADFETLSSLLVPLTHGELYETYDACLNIDGLQAAIPDGFNGTEQGVCTEREDQIPAIDTGSEEPQGELPFISSLSGLLITEILPNPMGSDTNNEFIELYNDTSIPLNLLGLVVRFGVGQDKFFTLGNTELGPHAYLVLSSADNNFTLTNTEGMVALYDIDGLLIDKTDPYSNAPDGQSWSFLENTWLFTKSVSPGMGNQISSTESVESDETTSDTLTPCSSGQERNPETNRCRKIASDQDSALVPCADGQERNPETNRCRAVAVTEKTPTACKEGQERNPETNRCRNVQSTTPPVSDYGVMGASDNEGDSYMLWAIIALAVVALGYAIWEWREPLKQLLQDLRTKLKRGS